ncbi:tetratricopeptide repeat protein [Algoriphagus sediminis]|uniref:Tetratricopeptide repeat protein n=1 Tax=Algoriphagus sediminis TaxID=3057113 RepID=A0ABT7Y8L8_9BACT|nr:tetratricopeptide repeat protein [Algoriphagus sediminis]MDN3202828.1 tetratricopeptide repeat protein [Algoriphagus sediminis]
MKITKLIILIFCLILTGPEVLAQKKLSKKERKALEAERSASRYLIEGEKQLVLGDLDKAYFYLQKSLEFEENEPAIHYKIAEVLTRANRPQEALPYANTAVELNPENKYYSLLVAEIYKGLKQPLAAAAILDSLTVDGESNQQYNLDLASLYLQAGEMDKALVVLTRAEEYYGVYEPITRQKQRIYLSKNDLEGAIREGEALIEARPGNPKYVLNLVEILFNNNRSQEALALVLKEIERYPNQPELQMAAYSLYEDAGMKNQARPFLLQGFAHPDLEAEGKTRTFEAILSEIRTQERDNLLDTLASSMLELHPNDSFVYKALGDRAKQDGNQEEAIELYKQSLSLNAKNEKLIEEVILGSFGITEDLGALEKFTIMGVDEFPNRPDFWFYDGVVKSAIQKDSSAVVSLEKALEINGGQNEQLEQVARGTLGSSLYNIGEKERAFENFERAVKLDANDETVLNNYAYFLSLENRDLDKAREMSAKVVARFPDNGTFLDTYAWILFQMGEYKEAEKYMLRAIEAEEEPSGVMLEHYGDILFHVGKRNEALAYWQKAEGSPEASEKLPLKIQEKKYHE